MAFPSNPTNGQTYDDGTWIYAYQSTPFRSWRKIGLSTSGFAGNIANLAYAKSNTNSNAIASLSNTVNISFTTANAAYNTSNTAYNTANNNSNAIASLSNTVNAISNTVNVSFDALNIAYSVANSSLNIAVSAYDRANAANYYAFIIDANANAAFETANTALDLASQAGEASFIYSPTQPVNPDSQQAWFNTNTNVLSVYSPTTSTYVPISGATGASGPGAGPTGPTGPDGATGATGASGVAGQGGIPSIRQLFLASGSDSFGPLTRTSNSPNNVIVTTNGITKIPFNDYTLTTISSNQLVPLVLLLLHRLRLLLHRQNKRFLHKCLHPADM